MSIVARGGVVYEFYMGQYSIDFDYIFPLKDKHSPQGLGINLCSYHSKKILPELLVILLQFI